MDRNRSAESGRFALVYWSMTLQDVLHIEKEALTLMGRYLLAGTQGEQESGESQSILIRAQGARQAQAVAHVQRAQAGPG
jgi:hypothetical protein